VDYEEEVDYEDLVCNNDDAKSTKSIEKHLI
jgi:hypothetical protein